MAVIKPVFEPDVAKLEKEAAKHYRTLKPGAGLSRQQAETLAGVFEHWLFERLKDRTLEEIAMILDLPDIEDTRAGRQLVERGEQRGEQRGMEEGMERGVLALARKRFGDDEVGADLEVSIRKLGTPELDRLFDELLDLPDAAALRKLVEDLA